MRILVVLGLLWLPPLSVAADPRNAMDHWAFQTPVAPALKGAGHPVDELLAIAQEAKNLPLGPAASRPVLLRRAWHILTGLQPEQETQSRLLNDQGALETWVARVVDGGLASPHFGERWARHWLDVARYADTKGYNFTAGRRYPYAFTYRDWVIRSLNEDLPYDEFLRRQLAADLMDLPDREQAALGFLTVGRRFLNKEDLIIADRIDVTFRSTMGLTMQCVRCHDHKFDPLTMADYYGIYGVFDSVYEPDEGDLPVVTKVEEDTPDYRKFRAELTKRANAAHDYAAKKIKGYKRPAEPLKFDRKAALRRLNQAERGEYERLIAKMAQLEATSQFAPARAMVVRDRPGPREPVIFERGQPGSRGAQVPRAFPAFFREDSKKVFTQGSGRLELARELTGRRNPLTARVWANRVWMHVMGEPLVSSPGDFGVQAERPLHPELLDHLAVWLMEHDWSTKALVRHIMTSMAWRRSSKEQEVLAKIDPENRYYVRSNRHRKNLEAWRDTTLQVSGRLQRELGGRSVKIHEAPFPPRRSIYGLIERQNPPSFFRIFDFPDSNQPAVRRAATITPNQALYLMNSPFLHGEAKAAAAATAGESDEARRVSALYQRVLQRIPSSAELARARLFLRGDGAHREQTAGAWRYGHGRVHRDSGRVDFQPLAHYTGEAWQGGLKLPDGETGWVHWRAQGGHPGHGDHAAILRWVSPRVGKIDVEGVLHRPAKEGDGIRGLVVTEGRILREWAVGPGKRQKTELAAFEVKAGQAVDFVVESTGDESWDNFLWAPVISVAGERVPLAEARAGFSGPALDSWPLLAQVLLLSNEFLFVD